MSFIACKQRYDLPTQLEKVHHHTLKEGLTRLQLLPTLNLNIQSPRGLLMLQKRGVSRRAQTELKAKTQMVKQTGAQITKAYRERKSKGILVAKQERIYQILDLIPTDQFKLQDNEHYGQQALMGNAQKSQKGFTTGLQVAFRTDQAWNVPHIGTSEPDLYPGGYFEVGHQFRPRQASKELRNAERPNITCSFDLATNPNYLGKKDTLSQSHRKLDAQLFNQKVLYHQNEYQTQKTLHSTQQNLQRRFSVTSDALEDKNEAMQQRLEDTKEQIQIQTQSCNQKIMRPSTGTKEHQKKTQQARVGFQAESAGTKQKHYIKSIESFVPVGVYTSSQFHNNQLSIQLQSQRVSRPSTAIQRPTLRSNQSEVLMQMSPQSKNSYPIWQQRGTQPEKSNRPFTATNKPIVISRPQSSCTSNAVFTEGARLSNIERPFSGLQSVGSAYLRSTKHASKTSQISTKEAVSKHFD